MKSDLWLVRHGQSIHHQTAQLQWDEVPLSKEGHRQAQQLAERMRSLEGISVVYSSPMRRALDTAAPIAAALGLELTVHTVLREISFGEAGGLTIAEFHQRWPDLYQEWQPRDNMEFRWPGGESRGEFQDRALAGMTALAEAHRGEQIIVVSHTGILCSYLAHLFLGDGSRWRDFVLQPASVSHVVLKDGQARLLLQNDISHLEE